MEVETIDVFRNRGRAEALDVLTKQDVKMARLMMRFCKRHRVTIGDPEYIAPKGSSDVEVWITPEVSKFEYTTLLYADRSQAVLYSEEAMKNVIIKKGNFLCR